MQMNDGTVISNDMYDIYSINYTTAWTGIKGTAQAGEKLLEYISDDAIAVNATAGTKIEIYSISGSHIYTVQQSNDNATISIATLPKGIYLLRANDRTAKFLKK